MVCNLGRRKTWGTALIPGIISYALLLVLSILNFYFISLQYGYVFFAFQILLFLIVVANMLRTTMMDPGFYQKADKDEYKEDDYRIFQYVTVNGQQVGMKWCATCYFYRPPRTVHCSECDYCVDSFDHHCPYLCNCIGRRNHRYFMLFLTSLLLHMIGIIVTCSLYIASTEYQSYPLRFIIACVLIGVASILCIPVGGLTGFHVYLISVGRNTNEQVTHRYPKGEAPFSRGCPSNWFFLCCAPQYPRLKWRNVHVVERHPTAFRYDRSKDTVLAFANGRTQTFLTENPAESQELLEVIVKEDDALYQQSSSVGAGAPAIHPNKHLSVVCKSGGITNESMDHTPYDTVVGTIGIGNLNLLQYKVQDVTASPLLPSTSVTFTNARHHYLRGHRLSGNQDSSASLSQQETSNAAKTNSSYCSYLDGDNGSLPMDQNHVSNAQTGDESSSITCPVSGESTINTAETFPLLKPTAQNLLSSPSTTTSTSTENDKNTSFLYHTS